MGRTWADVARQLGVALLATAAAVAIGLALPPTLQRFAAPELLLGAIAISAWYGGLAAGLVATSACGAASLVLRLPPLVTEQINDPVGTVVHIGVFVLVAALISALRGTVRAAGERAAASARTADVRQRRLAFLAEASDVLAGSLEYETTLRSVARLAVPFLADWCVVDLCGPDGRIHRVAIEHVDPAMARFARELDVRYPVDPGSRHPVAQALRTGTAGLVAEVSDALLEQAARNPEQLAGYRRLGARSGMVVPLIARGRTLGAISTMMTTSGRRYGAEDLAFAEDLARRCAAAIDNAQLYQSAQVELAVRRRAEQRLGLQYATTRILDQCATLEDAAPHILRAVCECLDLVHGALWRVDPAANVLRCVETWHRPEVDVDEFTRVSRDISFTAGVGLPGRVWASAAPAWIPDVVQDTNFPRGPVAARQNLHGAFGFPVRIGAEVLGVLEFFDASIAAPDDELLAMMATIGSQIGQFMERRRVERERAQLLVRVQAAHAEARSAERRAAFLAEASRVLGTSLDHTATLANLADLAVPLLADWCTIDLVGADGTAQRVAAAHLDPERRALLLGLLERYPPTGASALRDAVSAGLSTLLPTVELDTLLPIARDATHREAIAALDIRSFILVPLLARGRVLGAMSFAASVPGRYDARDVSLAEDIAYRAALAVDNSRLYQHAQESARRKDEFLAMLGHELRNPLGAIRSAVQVLDRISSQSEPAVRQRAIIDRQTRHLARLVDDLLDVSRVVTGKISLQREPIDLGDVATRCVQALRVRRTDREQSVTLTRPEEPVMVAGDPVRLEQVLSNLLDNAVKYTPEQGHVEVIVERSDDRAVVRVRDDGMGITAELLPRVFDLFAQAQRSLDRAQGGLGLGLSLVRRLVEQHGGTASASSDGPDRGSEFVVSLPLLADAVQPEAQPVAAAITEERGAAVGRHILIIEDNPDGREALRTLLELAGHRVAVAEDGPRGVEIACRDHPEVALVDIGLPGLDGYKVAAALRAELGTIRLIALTGYGQPEDRRRALDAGFDDHLVKPVEPDQLARALIARTADGG